MIIALGEFMKSVSSNESRWPVATFFSMLTLSLLVACNPSTAELSLTPSQIAPRSTERSPTPTATAESSATLTPTPTISSPPTSTSTTVASIDLSAGSVLGVSFLSGDRLMVSLSFPTAIEGEFRAVAQGEEFACQILDEYPDRLYCIGPVLEPDTAVRLVLFQASITPSVFESTFSIPIPTATAGAIAGSSPGSMLIQFGGAHGLIYSPAQVTISAGRTVEWVGDFSVHPLVSDDGLFATVSSGSAFSFTFSSPGSYKFHCQVHEALGMKGQVDVG